MAVFEFRGVLAASGKEVKGVRDADNPKGLRAVLRREGIVLTSANETRAASEKKSRDIQLFAFMSRPSIGDIAILTRQLGTLVRAGIPLTDALAALGEQTEKEELKRVLASVREEVNQGTSFAVALADHPKIFPPLYVNMVAAGEASGTLESVLDRLAQFMDTQSKLRGKVQAALAYPVLMTIIGSVLLTVLMMGVVPKVTAIFGTLGKALPWYTSVLIFVSESFVSPTSHGIVLGALVITGAWPFLVPAKEPVRYAGAAKAASDSRKGKPSRSGIAMLSIGSLLLLAELLVRQERGALLIGAFLGFLLGAGLGTFIAFLRTERGRFARDNLMLNVPIFGPLVQMIGVARFSKTLATLLSSGVQLLRAMEIVRAVIGNAALERVIDEASTAIREGESIAEPLRRSKKFPPIVTHMISVGERSGQLEQMLEAVSDSYETAVDTRITALTSLLEPLIIVVMGGAVGFVAFAILMPLIQMNDFNTGQ